MKAKQFCSVCKQWLDMEVAPTGEDDDGVIWFRCPQCQGYLPKLGGDDPPRAAETDAASEEARDASARDASRAVASGASRESGEPRGADESAADLPWDSPADMMAAREAGEATDDVLAERAGDDPGASGAAEAGDADDGAGDEEAGPDREGAVDAAEPIAEYAARLAALDPTTAVPYRPWDSYTVGQCIHHLAWDDCGVVVAKESLPGGRRVVKCYFASAGVVRLIEEASR